MISRSVQASIKVFIYPPIFNEVGVKGFFTTRALNSGAGDISKIFNLPLDRIYLPTQRHTDEVVVADYDFRPKIADAVVTKRKGILIGIQVADCVPILLYDKRMHVMGAVHAGWKGTAEGILKKTIKVKLDKFYSSPSDLVIAIGPSIGLCCYSVGHEVIEAVVRTTGKGDYFIKKGEKYCLDLPAANKHQAISSGVPLENIWVSGECTSCLPEKYYSYRNAKGATGRQCGFIGIV
ncbi:MAG: peptidoglycan editing factor PgeF [Thermodesulfovibrionales bacterium]|nr:peptidoglycan editing factor PgeF [Thermodesulfovibrionales bacterium]MCL0062526.1 peptidoglycan editing factor PgeF [Thermodesulfovibrionales bacterium]MCL0071425.1 peptidoglycan editing factor PgeF [Thermodesulfovibrionales bacterium]